MTTNPKTSNASGALSHPEPAADTNPRRLYEVTVYRTDYRYALIRVDGATEAEAKAIAKEAAEFQDESSWKLADRDLYVAKVDRVTQGGANE